MDAAVGWSSAVTGVPVAARELSSGSVDSWAPEAVVMATGSERTEYVTEALRLRANDFLRKPIEADELTDEVLTEIWKQVGILRDHGIAHRDLRLANVFLDEENVPWIIDFGFSELAASDLLLSNGVAELITSSALLVGPDRAVRWAVEVLGADAVSDAAPRVQPQALSGATRSELKERGDHIDRRVRDEIVSTTGRAVTPLDRIQRLDPGRRTRNRA